MTTSSVGGAAFDGPGASPVMRSVPRRAVPAKATIMPYPDLA